MLQCLQMHVLGFCGHLCIFIPVLAVDVSAVITDAKTA